MAHLPTTERLLLGPGPSPVSPHVMAALTASPRSHLDPDMMAILDDVRARLRRVCHAGEGASVLAVSGARHRRPGGRRRQPRRAGASARWPWCRVTSATGSRKCWRATDGDVTRLDVEWGRAVDPEAVRRALAQHRVDLVAVVRRCRDFDGRAQSSRRHRAHRPRARRADDCRRGHLARRNAARHGGVGRGRGVLVFAERTRRAVGHVADHLLGPRARAPRDVPQFLSGPRPARRLLAPAQVPPHDLGAARLRVARRASGRSKTRACPRGGSGTSITTWRSSRSSTRSGCRSSRHPPIDCGA